MTMKAAEVLQDLFEGQLNEHGCDMVGIIQQALNAAHDEALEKAAKEAALKVLKGNTV